MSAVPSITKSSTLSHHELAELIGAFNEVTTRLQVSHDSLNGEVARLKRELRSANDELERSRRLAALGEMAAGIAHEIRNPLGSIRLHARLLEGDLDGRPEELATIEKILRAVHGLDAVVGDVLVFAREIRVHPESVTAEELLGHALDSCVAEMSDEVEIVRSLDDSDGRPVEMWCDAALAHRALVNVVRNALESMAVDPAMPRRLELHAGTQAGEEDGGDLTVLAIRDSGPGVPPEAMERIFNPFFTTRQTGTGLGLAIVHRTMEAHAGSVRISNTSPRGAQVELLFPGRPAVSLARDRASRHNGVLT